MNNGRVLNMILRNVDSRSVVCLHDMGMRGRVKLTGRQKARHKCCVGTGRGGADTLNLAEVMKKPMFKNCTLAASGFN